MDKLSNNPQADVDNLITVMKVTMVFLHIKKSKLLTKEKKLSTKSSFNPFLSTDCG